MKLTGTVTASSFSTVGVAFYGEDDQKPSS
jgi:hypothetical protein